MLPNMNQMLEMQKVYFAVGAYKCLGVQSTAGMCSRGEEKENDSARTTCSTPPPESSLGKDDTVKWWCAHSNSPCLCPHGIGGDHRVDWRACAIDAFEARS